MLFNCVGGVGTVKDKDKIQPPVTTHHSPFTFIRSIQIEQSSIVLLSSSLLLLFFS